MMSCHWISIWVILVVVLRASHFCVGDTKLSVNLNQVFVYCKGDQCIVSTKMMCVLCGLRSQLPNNIKHCWTTQPLCDYILLLL